MDYFDAHPSTAALIVEVADSSLGLDRKFKHGLYARAGIADYWIANLVDGGLEVHRDPAPSAEAEFGAVYRQVEVLRPAAFVTPLAAANARMAVVDLLPRARSR
jgi:hypothetical protein